MPDEVVVAKSGPGTTLYRTILLGAVGFACYMTSNYVSLKDFNAFKEASERRYEQLRTETQARLSRIETKLDRVLFRQAGEAAANGN